MCLCLFTYLVSGCSNPYTVIIEPGKTSRAVRVAEPLKKVNVWYADSTKTWKYGRIELVPVGTWLFFGEVTPSTK